MANGTQWLTDLVNEKHGTSYSNFQMRDMLRRLAKNGEIEGKERGARYNFSGEKDKTVKAVLKYVSSGQADKDRREELDKVKENKKAKDQKPSKKAKEAPAAEEDIDDLDDLD